MNGVFLQSDFMIAVTVASNSCMLLPYSSWDIFTNHFVRRSSSDDKTVRGPFRESMADLLCTLSKMVHLGTLYILTLSNKPSIWKLLLEQPILRPLHHMSSLLIVGSSLK